MRDLSRPTQIYILSTVIFAIGVATWQLYFYPPEGSFLLLLACVAASFLQSISVFGTTARSTYSLSWIIYAFTLIYMGPSATIVVVFVSHLAEWILDPERLKWYIQTFNIANFFIGFTISGLLMRLGETFFGGNSEALFFTNLFALAVFTLANHLMIAWVLKLARGQNLVESGVFGSFTLILDFTLLCLGYTAAYLWQVTPVAFVLIIFIAHLLYQALNIPALERKTEIDAKTELYNARYFTAAVDEEMVRAKRFKRPLSLIMADLDLLRNINNSYGHLAGDVVLQGIAKTLQEMTREYDIVSRFGGEEFAILLPETEINEAYIVAERIRERIAATEFEVTTSVEPIRATMSLGIAGLEGSKQTTDNLIHNADVALYKAKETGRNRTCVHNGEEHLRHKTSRDWGKLGISVKEMPEAPTPQVNGKSNGVVPTNLEETAPVQSGGMSTMKEEDTAVLPPTSPKQKRTYPQKATTFFITGMVSLAVILTLLLIRNDPPDFNWFALLFFAGFVLIAEAAAIEIYVRESSVSTSASLLIAGVLLFGPMGAVVLGASIAFIAYAKQKTDISRFLFNTSNHTIGGLFIASLLAFIPVPVSEWSLGGLLVIGVTAAAILYLSTTICLTIVIGLSTGQRFKTTWTERFRWLSLYYLALGVIAAVLVLSYNVIDMTGIIIIFLPLFMMRYSQKQYIENTKEMVQNLQKTNTQLLQKSEEVTLLNEELLLTLARSLDLRDPHVMEHSKHVSRYAVCIAQEMKLPAEQLETIRKAGLLHDIGKLGVREEILFKPSRLTAEEFELVKQHVTIGAELVRGCHTLEPLVPFVLHHHEWFDGRGYPHGLAGEEIPLEARILSLADAVEAMASDRPYKQSMSPEAIRDEVKRCSGNQFDPAVVKAFVQIVDREGDEIIVNSAREVLARKMGNAETYEQHY